MSARGFCAKAMGAKNFIVAESLFTVGYGLTALAVGGNGVNIVRDGDAHGVDSVHTGFTGNEYIVVLISVLLLNLAISQLSFSRINNKCMLSKQIADTSSNSKKSTPICTRIHRLRCLYMFGYAQSRPRLYICTVQFILVILRRLSPLTRNKKKLRELMKPHTPSFQLIIHRSSAPRANCQAEKNNITHCKKNNYMDIIFQDGSNSLDVYTM